MDVAFVQDIYELSALEKADEFLTVYGPVYTVPDEFLAAQIFVLIGVASTLYLVIRTNICPVSRSNI